MKATYNHSRQIGKGVTRIGAQKSSDEQERIYRIDKFKVPDSARREFVERVRKINEFLGTLRGFVQNYVFEQSGGQGESNFVTITVWDSMESVELARKAAAIKFKEIGYNPQEFLARLQIRADQAIYREIT